MPLFSFELTSALNERGGSGNFLKIQIYPRKRKRKRKRERGENQLMWLAFAQLNSIYKNLPLLRPKRGKLTCLAFAQLNSIYRNLPPLKAALTNWSSLQFATLASAEMRSERRSFRRDAERRRS